MGNGRYINDILNAMEEQGIHYEIPPSMAGRGIDVPRIKVLLALALRPGDVGYSPGPARADLLYETWRKANVATAAVFRTMIKHCALTPSYNRRVYVTERSQ